MTIVDEAGLRAIARDLAATLPAGAVLWLEGDLGAGKTTLVRALVAARGVETEASSPTYALVHRYEGPRGPIHHVDCYRLRQADEARELDWGGMLLGDLLVIEWPGQAGAWVPQPTRVVRLAHTTDPLRRSVVLHPAEGRA